MTDYIERKDAIKAVADMLAFEAEMDYCDTFTSDDFIDDAKGYFEDIPSADVAPVRHGRWKHERLPSTSGGSYAVVRCSVCEYQYPMAETRYCPNCGAKMDGERKDDDTD